MYNITEKFLYEILDDYKDVADEKEKDEIVNAFMKLIWSNKNKRSVFQKDLRFSVSKSLLDTDIGQIFNTYSAISYISYRSMSKNTDFVSLIRQKVNNIYTNLCDGNVCFKKEYMDLIKLPKQMYYRWKSGEEYDVNTLTSQLEDIFAEADKVKEKYAKQKMSIEWYKYKTLIIPYFKRMFENYIPLEKFEDKSHFTIDINTWNEDNFAVAYLCKGLDGYMRNYQKEFNKIKRGRDKKYTHCVDCGKLIDKTNNKINHCKECAKKNKVKLNKKYREENRKNNTTIDNT